MCAAPECERPVPAQFHGAYCAECGFSRWRGRFRIRLAEMKAQLAAEDAPIDTDGVPVEVKLGVKTAPRRIAPKPDRRAEVSECRAASDSDSNSDSDSGGVPLSVVVAERRKRLSSGHIKHGLRSSIQQPITPQSDADADDIPLSQTVAVKVLPLKSQVEERESACPPHQTGAVSDPPEASAPVSSTRPLCSTSPPPLAATPPSSSPVREDETRRHPPLRIVIPALRTLARNATPPTRAFPPTKTAAPTSALSNPVPLVNIKSLGEIPQDSVSQEVFTPTPAPLKPTIRRVRLILGPRPPTPPISSASSSRDSSLSRAWPSSTPLTPLRPTNSDNDDRWLSRGWDSDDSKLTPLEDSGESEIDFPDSDMDGDEEEVAELLALATPTEPTTPSFSHHTSQNVCVKVAQAKREHAQQASKHRGQCWSMHCENLLPPGWRYHRCSKCRYARRKRNKVLRSQDELIHDDSEVRL